MTSFHFDKQKKKKPHHTKIIAFKRNIPKSAAGKYLEHYFTRNVGKLLLPELAPVLVGTQYEIQKVLQVNFYFHS